MKKKGSTSDFTSARDRELYSNFLDILRSSCQMPLRDMFGAAALRGASRFWVSERRAADVVSLWLRDENADPIAKMYPERREMYAEIVRRVKARMAADPDLCMTHAVDLVVNEPAPRFYLSAAAAKQIIYRHRRRRILLNRLASKTR